MPDVPYRPVTMTPEWFVYVLRCADGSLYTGITNDLPRRLKQHNTGTASRYTRGRIPVELAHHEPWRKSVFLGKYDTPESRQRYAEIVSKITSGQPVETSTKAVSREPVRRSVASLVLRFIAEKLPSYADAEQHCFRGAMRILVELFGKPLRTILDQSG